MKKLNKAFYQRDDVLGVAYELLGKLIITKWNGELTAGRIVETEAYMGVTDKASHAYGGRRTARTEIMYASGGVAYVYLCYGMHHLFNVVTGSRDEPHAVLLRAIEPVARITVMLKRIGKAQADFSLGSGPGNLSRALGINTSHSGLSLHGSSVFIADDGYESTGDNILATPRIGVDYAGEDALLPYRFMILDNLWVSKKNAFTAIKKIPIE